MFSYPSHVGTEWTWLEMADAECEPIGAAPEHGGTEAGTLLSSLGFRKDNDYVC